MERSPLPFQTGALYNRRIDIHERWGGQRQGGISTPKDEPFVFIFSGEAGKTHGYHDEWSEKDGLLNYFGEGQSGDMTMTAGNRAINQHVENGKRLLVFKSLGKGKPYRFDGEFVKRSSYVQPNTPATRGPPRNAIVFRLDALDAAPLMEMRDIEQSLTEEEDLDSTVAIRLSKLRTKQNLFRRRLIDVEKQCRLTGIMDLRFLRASHIKPWAACATATERTDGNNGLLLTPTPDLLFDQGWISFERSGHILFSQNLPNEVESLVASASKCAGPPRRFNAQQALYLEFHRDQIFESPIISGLRPIVKKESKLRCG